MDSEYRFNKCHYCADVIVPSDGMLTVSVILSNPERISTVAFCQSVCLAMWAIGIGDKQIIMGDYHHQVAHEFVTVRGRLESEIGWN